MNYRHYLHRKLFERHIEQTFGRIHFPNSCKPVYKCHLLLREVFEFDESTKNFKKNTIEFIRKQCELCLLPIRNRHEFAKIHTRPSNKLANRRQFLSSAFASKMKPNVIRKF